VALEAQALRRRIEDRAGDRFGALVEETRALLDRGFGPFACSAHLIGYAEAAAFLRGELSADEAVARIAKRDRALARRQVAWFRRDPRVRWFRAGPEGAAGIAEELAGYLSEGIERAVEA
jgi:tRNA dimethylallyltransferase